MRQKGLRQSRTCVMPYRATRPRSGESVNSFPINKAHKPTEGSRLESSSNRLVLMCLISHLACIHQASFWSLSSDARCNTPCRFDIGLVDQDLSLTLADLGGVSECIFHALPDMARNLYTVSARPGHERNLMRPYFTAYGCDRVAECHDRFWIPCGGSRLKLS